MRIDQELSDPEVDEVLRLAHNVSSAQQRQALSDDGRRHLSAKHDVQHFRLFDGSILVAYAQLRIAATTCELELLGDVLTEEFLDAARQIAAERGLGLSCWLHGLRSIEASPHPRLRRARTLRRLGRPLSALAAPATPEAVTVRPFVVGIDEDDFLAVNAAAFDSHPDQGAMSLDDVVQRESESWFDPALFLLAVEDDELLGFCWVKVHDDPWGRAGEIYVIGVSPAASGRGLGRVLLRHGLGAMADAGLSEAFLYVEDDNAPALGLYDAEGFGVSWYDARFEVTRD